MRSPRKFLNTILVSRCIYSVKYSYIIYCIKDRETNLRLFLTFSNLNLSADLCLILSESSNVFVSLNCFLNPVIYGFLNTAYRQSIIRTEISDVCRQDTGIYRDLPGYTEMYQDKPQKLTSRHCVTQNKENLN